MKTPLAHLPGRCRRRAGITLLEMVIAVGMISTLLAFYLQWESSRKLEQRAAQEADKAVSIVNLINTYSTNQVATTSDILAHMDDLWPSRLTSKTVNIAAPDPDTRSNPRLKLLGRRVEVRAEDLSASGRPLRGLMRLEVRNLDADEEELAERIAVRLRRRGIPAGLKDTTLVIWMGPITRTLTAQAIARNAQASIGTDIAPDATFNITGTNARLKVKKIQANVAAGHHVDGWLQQSPFDFRIHKSDPIHHPAYWRWDVEADKSSWGRLPLYVQRRIEDGLVVPNAERDTPEFRTYLEDIRFWKQFNDRAVPHLHYSAGLMRGYSGWGWFPCAAGSAERWVHINFIGHTGARIRPDWRRDQCLMGSVAMSRTSRDGTPQWRNLDQTSGKQSYGGLYSKEAVVIAAGGPLHSSPTYWSDSYNPFETTQDIIPLIRVIPEENDDEKYRNRIYLANNIGDSWSGRCFGIVTKAGNYSDRHMALRQSHALLVQHPQFLSDRQHVSWFPDPIQWKERTGKDWTHPALWSFSSSAHIELGALTPAAKPYFHGTDFYATQAGTPSSKPQDRLSAALAVRHYDADCRIGDQAHVSNNTESDWLKGRQMTTPTPRDLLDTDLNTDAQNLAIPVYTRFYHPQNLNVKANGDAVKAMRIYPLGQFFSSHPKPSELLLLLLALTSTQDSLLVGSVESLFRASNYVEGQRRSHPQEEGAVPEGGIVPSYGGAFNITGMVPAFGRHGGSYSRNLIFGDTGGDLIAREGTGTHLLDPRTIHRLIADPLPVPYDRALHTNVDYTSPPPGRSTVLNTSNLLDRIKNSVDYALGWEGTADTSFTTRHWATATPGYFGDKAEHWLYRREAVNNLQLHRYWELVARRIGHKLSDPRKEPLLHGLCPGMPAAVDTLNTNRGLPITLFKGSLQEGAERNLVDAPIKDTRAFYNVPMLSGVLYDDLRAPGTDPENPKKLLKPGTRPELLRYGMPWRLARRAFFGGPTDIKHPADGSDVGDPDWIIDPLGHGARLGRGLCAGALAGFPLTMENGHYRLEGTHVFNHSFEIQSDTRLKDNSRPLNAPQGGLSSLRLDQVQMHYPDLLSESRLLDPNGLLAVLWEEVRSFAHQVHEDYSQLQIEMQQLEAQLAAKDEREHPPAD